MDVGMNHFETSRAGPFRCLLLSCTFVLLSFYPPIPLCLQCIRSLTPLVTVTSSRAPCQESHR
jgi:hypothetical protein